MVCVSEWSSERQMLLTSTKLDGRPNILMPDQPALTRKCNSFQAGWLARQNVTAHTKSQRVKDISQRWQVAVVNG